MHRYIGFGLQICSDFSLPGFVPGERAELPEVRIEQRPVPLERWRELNDDGLKLAGVARGVMKFQVEHGASIAVEPEPGADLDYLRAIVSGELMSALLRQRGLLALHASCVARDGKAIGFIGHSGWGKSTLATHFVQHGYRLLADDVLAVQFTPEAPLAVPGYPQVKLRADAGARYVDAFADLPEAHTETDKRLFSLSEQFQDEPVPIAKLYVLEPYDRPASQVAPITPRDAFVELVRHTRASNLIKSPAFRQAHLDQIARLMAAVPVSLFHRQRSLERLPELYELVERDLRQSRRRAASLPAA